MGANLRISVFAFARQPLFHFVLIGAVIAILYGWWGGRDAGETDMTIRISAGDISRLEAEWLARWNRPPTPEELDGLIKARIREAALYREALAMGLDDGDPVIRRILVQKLEGMARDLVELSLSPTDQDLQAYFAEHAERYRPPPLITFTHIFVDPDRKGDQTLADADAILAELKSIGPPPENVESYGDQFMLQRYYPEKSELRIGSLFGREFARSIFELPTGQWNGPVLSGYGTHLVYVHELQEYPDPTLQAVKESVREDWVGEKRQEITDQYFAGILARYDVIVEQEPAEGRVEAAAVQTP